MPRRGELLRGKRSHPGGCWGPAGGGELPRHGSALRWQKLRRFSFQKLHKPDSQPRDESGDSGGQQQPQRRAVQIPADELNALLRSEKGESKKHRGRGKPLEICAVAFPNSEGLWLLRHLLAASAERRHGAQRLPRLLVPLQPASPEPNSLTQHLAAIGGLHPTETNVCGTGRACLRGLQDTEKRKSPGSGSQGNLWVFYTPPTPLLGCTRLPFSSSFVENGVWKAPPRV